VIRIFRLALALCVLLTATVAAAQETGIHVRSIRVLATNPAALAVFYEKAFGMAETRRAANSPTLTEIVINSGSTTEIALKATTTPLVITTRPKDAPAGAMASLILQVPNLDKAIESVKANGGTLMRGPSKSGETLMYAFVKDPDGNQIEMVMPIT
jgi:predicted enzyme related to lactoylglutathione lyase